MSSQEFKIDIKKLSESPRELEYELNKEFFNRFEKSPIKIGHFNTRVSLSKVGQTIEARVVSEGNVQTNCDRCGSEISLPVSGDELFIFKKDKEDWDDDLTIMLEEGVDHFYIDSQLYEAAVLSLPMQMVYDCEDEQPRPCDEEILEKLNQVSQVEPKNNALQEQLKNLNLKN